MSGQELVSFNDSLVTYGPSVVAATRVMTPFLRSAGSLITRISACSVEIKAIRMEAARHENRARIADTLMRHRATQLVHQFRHLESIASVESVQLSQISLTVSAINSRIIDPALPTQEILLLSEALDMLMARSIQLTARANDRIIHLSDAISIESTARAIRMLDL